MKGYRILYVYKNWYLYNSFIIFFYNNIRDKYLYNNISNKNAIFIMRIDFCINELINKFRKKKKKNYNKFSNIY